MLFLFCRIGGFVAVSAQTRMTFWPKSTGKKEKKENEQQSVPRQELCESRAKMSDTKPKNWAGKSGFCVAHRNVLNLYCGS